VNTDPIGPAFNLWSLRFGISLDVGAFAIIPGWGEVLFRPYRRNSFGVYLRLLRGDKSVGTRERGDYEDDDDDEDGGQKSEGRGQWFDISVVRLGQEVSVE
jgi:hypothetical protein